MTDEHVPYSVLDLAPIGEGSTATDALRNSRALVQLAERLGFHRYWVAEHHNMPGIASSSPAVLIEHLASATTTMRIGSGGVMLPNHAPLVVAEQFGMLDALHPDRIDLGIGRAPGTDPATAMALRRGAMSLSADEFPEELGALVSFFSGSFPPRHPYARITAVPGRGNRPALWLLGSSDYSARLAGRLGWPFSFAHHFASANTRPALAAYRAEFEPSAELAEPYAMVAAAVICAPSEAEARWLAGSSRLSFLRLRSGRPGPFPTPEEAAGYQYTPAERDFVKGWTASHIVGDPAQVREQLDELRATTGANELMITTMVHGHEARLRSYELVAEAMGIAPRDDAAPADDGSTAKSVVSR
jgi:luciferase family oxidoreductase group 1